MKRNRLFILLLLCATHALSACATPVTYSAEPIEAWIVDAETKQPLEGVVVVAHWVLEGGIHVDRMGDFMIIETVTDKNGRFYFPAWGPLRHWGRSRLTYMDPEIIIFKSSYEYRQLANEMTAEAIGGKAFPVRKSVWSGRTIVLRPFKEADFQIQYKNLLNFSKVVDSFATWHTDPCQWTKLPIAIKKMLRERKQLEAQGAHSVMDRTLDRQLLEGESYFIKQCGAAAKALIEGMKK